MKTWKKKVELTSFGICTVKEFSDTECDKYHPPFSHGFVNLYHGKKHVGWCGVAVAERGIIDKTPKKPTLPKKYEIRIQMVKDITTGRFGLILADRNGNGKRISNGKDTGSWHIMDTVRCAVTEDDLREYSYQKS